MKILIKLLFKDNKLRLYILVIIFIIASIYSFIQLKKYIFNEILITFEKGELPPSEFKILEFDSLHLLLDFKPKNFYEDLDKYVKENGIEKIIPESDLYEYEGLFIGNIKLFVIERNNEYVTIELCLTNLEYYTVFEYKVYFNKKIIPVYFYKSYHFGKFKTEFYFGFFITFGVLFGMRFLFKIIKKSKEKV